MRKLFSFIAATLFATTMFAAVQEFTVTISTANFNKTSYAANNNEKTSTAVSKSDPSVTMDVKWTSNQVMLKSDESSVQCQKTNGTIYNSAAWGTVKNIVINDGTNLSYTIGATEKPTTTATGGFFQIKTNSSGTGYFSSIVITFEADPAAASLHADNIELGDMLVEPNEAFEKVVSINVEASNLSAPIAFSTESPMLSFVTPGTTLPATGGELKVKITANHGDVINETVLLSSGSLSATVTISGEVWEKYYTPGAVDVKFEAGVKAQGGDTTTVNGQKAVKVGTSSDAGTAIITIPAGATKLYFLAAAWSGKPCTLTLSASGIDFSPTTAALKADDGIANTSPFFTKSGNLEQYLVELELSNVGADTEMTLTATTSNKRFVIWDVTCDKGDTPPTPPTPGVIEITNSDDTYYGDYVDDEGYWIFEVETSTYYLTLSNLDLTITQAAGTYTAAELDPEYTYLLTETDSIWFVDGSITLAVSGETTTIKGDLVGKDGNTYRLNLSCAPNPYRYDEDVNYAATFDSYEIDDTDFDSDGVILIQASQDGKGVMIGMFLPATATEAVPVAGTYPINDTYQPQTVAAGYFDETEGLIPSVAALVSGTSATNIWYLVSGTVTVNEYKTLTVVAKNSKNRDIAITLKGEDEPTSIANTKAANLKRKAIKNGHLFINANNVEYNVNGARVK